MWERLRSKYGRLVVASAETGVAAGVSWWLAGSILGVETPFYAPVAAVVVLGAGFNRRVGNVTSMLQGMAIAIVLAEVAVRLVGYGPMQVAGVTALAIAATKLVTNDQLAIVYAGLNAGILVGLGGEGWVPDRLVEALVGAGVAYGLIFLIIPPRPTRYARLAVDNQIDIARHNLGLTAHALRQADSEEAADAEKRSAQIDRNVATLDRTFEFSEEVSRFSPWRGGQASETKAMWGRAHALQQVLRNTTILVRVASRMAERNETPHAHLAEAIDEQAEAVETMRRITEYEFIDGEGALDLSEHTERARRLALRDCGDSDRLHQAVVEEVSSLTDEIMNWIDDLEHETRASQ